MIWDVKKVIWRHCNGSKWQLLRRTTYLIWFAPYVSIWVISVLSETACFIVIMSHHNIPQNNIFTRPCLIIPLGSAYMHPKEQTLVTLEPKYKTFCSWKCSWKSSLQNGGHFLRGADELRKCYFVVYVLWCVMEVSIVPIIEMPWAITMDHPGEIRWNHFPYNCTVCVVMTHTHTLSLLHTHTHTNTHNTHTWCIPSLMLKTQSKMKRGFETFLHVQSFKTDFDIWIYMSGIYGIKEN